jgi:hypothetical protein
LAQSGERILGREHLPIPGEGTAFLVRTGQPLIIGCGWMCDVLLLILVPFMLVLIFIPSPLLVILTPLLLRLIVLARQWSVIAVILALLSSPVGLRPIEV